jgi:proteasome lid subunit RPN8/RPN11
MDIEFGKLQQSKPKIGLRPDQDGQLRVAVIGQPASNELPIYVDLDVMREMEAHALSDTRVELGGVMLGYQSLDREGRPFVVIADCLRAEHYQATKGSFKFTHETWSQITRDRARFRPELEMVGWYHTHPGWSVFLSGMDLFICDHFFNRPLDVALVIDPCAGDRGWFYWRQAQVEIESDELSEDEGMSHECAPQRTRGFYLTTGRFRDQELKSFANLYNGLPPMHQDPRYAGQNSPSPFIGTGQTMVQRFDQRKPLLEVALASMMLMQFGLLALLAWRLAGPNPATASLPSAVAAQDRLELLEAKEKSRIAQEAQQEILQAILTAGSNAPDFVARYSDLKMENHQLDSNLSAQIVLTDRLKIDLAKTQAEVDEKSLRTARLSTQLQATQQELNETRSQLASMTRSSQSGKLEVPNSQEALTAKSLELPWWIALLSGLGILAIGGGTGFLVAQSSFMRQRFDSEFDRDPEEETG